MATISYEIKCCPVSGIYNHWNGLPKHWKRKLIISTEDIKKLETKLLRNGHRNVIIYKVTREALSMSQPLPDSGSICRKWYGMKCNLIHHHIGDQEDKAS